MAENSTKCKFYVYHLIDPRSDEVFYVGKGCRSRINQHEMDAKKGVDHPKCDVIRSIWGDGLQVKKVKVKYFSVEQDAYDFEALEVERIGLENLTNKQEGGGIAYSAGDRVEPMYVARSVLRIAAHILRWKATGVRINFPLGEEKYQSLDKIIDEVLKKVLKKYFKVYGNEFVSDELAKYKVEVTWQPA